MSTPAGFVGLSLTSALAAVVVLHDPSGRPVEATISGVGTDSVTRRYAYDALGDVVEEAVRLDASTWLAVRHEHDARQLRTRTLFPEGNAVEWEHDERGRVVLERRGVPDVTASSVRRWEFDGVGRIVGFVDGTGDRTTFEHDGFNRVQRVLRPEGVEERRDYDPVGNLVLLERYGPRSPGGFPELLERTRLDHDEGNRVVRTRREHLETGDEAVTVQGYDLLGRLVATRTPLGDVTGLVRDGLGRVTRVIDPLGNAVEHVLDPNGNVLVRREVETSGLAAPEAFTTTATYDRLDRLASVVDDLGQTVHLAYDARDNVVRRVDPRGNVTFHEFDAADRNVRTRLELREGGEGGGALAPGPHDPDGVITTTRVFDRNGRVTSIRDDRGNATRYRYDALDRVDLVTFADGRTISYTHDADGNLRTSTDASGTVVVRDYDGLDRLTSVDVVAGAGVVGTRAQRFEWDGLSRLVRATDDNGAAVSEPGAATSEVRREYDSLSRLVREAQDGRELAHEHRLNDTRSAVTYPSGRRLAFTHDGLERLVTIGQSPPGVGPPAPVAAFAYAGPSRLGQRASGNGVVLAPSYDVTRRPTGLRHERGGAALFAWRYAYDRSSNRTLQARDHEGGLEDRHRYDSASRLVETRFDAPPAGAGAGGGDPVPEPRVARGLERRSYVLDGVGNRVTVEQEAPGGGGPVVTGYAVDSTNAYTSVGAAALQTDANGNLVDDGAGRRFGYDAFNRLVTVETPTHRTRYGHDATGRRTRSDVTSLADGTTVSTLFLHDGMHCVEERVVGGPRSGEVRELVHGGRVDEVLFSAVTHGGTTRVYYHHEDVAGNTVALTDEDGVVVDEVAYDEWGVAWHRDPAAHAAAGNRYLFQGLRWDEEAGLYHVRARAYDPGLGRFVQRDPIGVWGDPVSLGNAYTFAGNNPVTWRDPRGLWVEDVVIAIPSIFLGARSLGRNLGEGNFGAAMADAVGLGLDVVALLLPGVSGGAGTALQASRAARVGTAGLKVAGLALSAHVEAQQSGWLDDDEYEDWDLEDLESEWDNCFLAGTLVVAGVQQSDGSFRRVLKRVEEVRADDWVRAKNPRTGEVGWKRVKRTFDNVTTEVWSITVGPAECLPLVRQAGRTERRRVGHGTGGEEDGEDGEPPPGSHVVRCTAGHPWAVRGADGTVRFSYTAALLVGDRLVPEPGAPEQVVLGIEVRQEVARTFNFEVEDWHTYYVAGPQGQPGVLVHNDSTYLERQGILFENAAQKAVRQSGATVIGGTKVGKGGFDFLSFTGTGTSAQLTINEVKNELGRVSGSKFTAFGQGRSGLRTLERNIRAGERAIMGAGLDRATRQTLLDQLRGRAGQANVRVIGSLGKETAVSSGVARDIQRSVRRAQRSLGATGAIRLPKFGRLRIP